MRFSAADWAFMLATLALAVLILLALRAMGLLGPLTFLQIL